MYNQHLLYLPYFSICLSALCNNWRNAAGIPVRSCTFSHVRRIATATITFVVSVRPRGTSRFPQIGFFWNLIFEYFSKICKENQIWLKYNKNSGYEDLCAYLWGTFQSKVVEAIKTHILCSNFFFENRGIYEIIWAKMVTVQYCPRCLQAA
jgi:hypothetical protein